MRRRDERLYSCDGPRELECRDNGAGCKVPRAYSGLSERGLVAARRAKDEVLLDLPRHRDDLARRFLDQQALGCIKTFADRRGTSACHGFSGNSDRRRACGAKCWLIWRRIVSAPCQCCISLPHRLVHRALLMDRLSLRMCWAGDEAAWRYLPERNATLSVVVSGPASLLAMRVEAKLALQYRLPRDRRGCRYRCRIAAMEVVAAASISAFVAARKSPGTVCLSALAAAPSATACVRPCGFSRYPARKPAA